LLSTAIVKGIGKKISKVGRTRGKTRPKSSTIKPPSILSVSCMKIQGARLWQQYNNFIRGKFGDCILVITRINEPENLGATNPKIWV